MNELRVVHQHPRTPRELERDQRPVRARGPLEKAQEVVLDLLETIAGRTWNACHTTHPDHAVPTDSEMARVGQASAVSCRLS